MYSVFNLIFPTHEIQNGFQRTIKFYIFHNFLIEKKEEQDDDEMKRLIYQWKLTRCAVLVTRRTEISVLALDYYLTTLPTSRIYFVVVCLALLSISYLRISSVLFTLKVVHDIHLKIMVRPLYLHVS